MAISELARQVAQAPVRRSADTAPAEALTARKVHRPHLKDRYQFTPKLPPYTPLPADQLAAAEARSANLTYPVRNIRSAGGYVNEPVSTVVSGTKEEIMAALEQAGWTEADAVSTISGLKTIGTLISDLPHINKHWHFQYDAAPVSDQFLDGRVHDLAFEKNSNHDLGRDHLRLWDTGKKDAAGRPIWEMATTRDYGVVIEPKQKHSTHLVDTEIDKERDMVMADLLKTGEVKDWTVANGVLSAEDEAATKARFQTDGKVYQVELQPHPELSGSLLYKQPSMARELLNQSPPFIQKGVHAMDNQITHFFKKLTG